MMHTVEKLTQKSDFWECSQKYKIVEKALQLWKTCTGSSSVVSKVSSRKGRPFSFSTAWQALGAKKHKPAWSSQYTREPLGPYEVSGASKPLAENEATWIPQPGAECGSGLEGKIIALVFFIGSE